MNVEKEKTDIWEKYEKSNNYMMTKAVLTRTERNWRFFRGDQWHGIKAGGEELPVLNFIKPICKYKIAVVAQHKITANYTDIGDGEPVNEELIGLLNKKFTATWENAKMDRMMWKIVKAAAIQGDSYIYFGEGVNKPRKLSNTSILFADEQEEDIQEQEYIMIRERISVKKVKEEAKKNGILAEDIEAIRADDETEYTLLNKDEVKGSEKCTSILYMTKKDGIVHVAKSVQGCVYKPLTPLSVKNNKGESVGGLKSYPVVQFIWEEVPDSARGASEVEAYISNQIEVNKIYARRAIAVKAFSFPKMAYSESDVKNPGDLDKVGAKIAIQGDAKKIHDAIAYLMPAGNSPDAKNLSDDITENTKELAGAGDAATASINPEQASGAAINAVRDQAELPLNEQVSGFRQFVEDIALLYIDMWSVYEPNGMKVRYTEDEEELIAEIPIEDVENLKLSVMVDISNANPWSRYAEQQVLLNLFSGGHISLEEYIEASSDNSPLPKAKLKRILEERKNKEMQDMEELPEAEEGGIYDRMPQMPEEIGEGSYIGGDGLYGMYEPSM